MEYTGPGENRDLSFCHSFTKYIVSLAQSTLIYVRNKVY